MGKPYWRMSATELQNTWLGMFFCIALALAIFYGIFYWANWYQEQAAASASRMTGQNITPEDIRFNGDRIRIIK